MEAGDQTKRSVRDLGFYEYDPEVLKAALVATANSVVITNADGIIEWVNPAFTALTGYERSEVIGKNPRILKSGFHTDEYYKLFWETIQRGDVWSGEFINHKKDGSLFVDLQTITPLREHDGKITHFVAVKQDITHHRHMQQALAESEAMFRTIFEQSMDAILLTVPNGSILRANAAASAMFGRTEEELQQIGAPGILDLSDPELIRSLEIRARMGAFKGRIRFIRKNGSTFFGEVRSNIFPTESGFQTSMIIRELGGEA